MSQLTILEINHFKEQLARFGDDTVVRCATCGRTQYLQFKNGLKNGWDICCGGYVMTIIYHQADIDAVVKNIVFGSVKNAVKLKREIKNERKTS